MPPRSKYPFAQERVPIHHRPAVGISADEYYHRSPDDAQGIFREGGIMAGVQVTSRECFFGSFPRRDCVVIKRTIFSVFCHSGLGPESSTGQAPVSSIVARHYSPSWTPDRVRHDVKGTYTFCNCNTVSQAGIQCFTGSRLEFTPYCDTGPGRSLDSRIRGSDYFRTFDDAITL